MEIFCAIFFCLFFFTITYLALLYLRDILLLTEKGLWSLNLPGANYFFFKKLKVF